MDETGEEARTGLDEARTGLDEARTGLDDAQRDARIAALVREGNAREAAAVARDAGRLLQAAELLASVWEWDEASALATAAGDLPLAYRYALETGAPDKRVALLRALYDQPDDALVAAEHAERRSRADEAAGLRMAAGDVDGAARLYEMAGDLSRAAAAHASAGRYRDAGKLYERRVREVPDDMEAHLALARLLARFGRDEPAARAFQAAAGAAIGADLPSNVEGARARVFSEAQRGLIACLDRMGFRDAATAALDELRQREPLLPLTIDEMRDAGELPLIGEAESTYLAGRYRVVKPLGSGATGRVFVARDAFYERDVAVKVLNVTSEGAGRDAYARFVREARIAAAIDHPHVVRVIEFNPDGPFLVVELLEGGTLEDRFAALNGALPLGDVRPIARAVLDGLEAVHRRGIVHRDLKPANVLFTAAGQVKLGDFGVAHLADFGATMTGALLGTLAYMAPEQVTGGKPDASTDLYAFGVMLSRMLTGHLPFPGPDYLSQLVNDPPPPPSRLRPALGTVYDALILALLAKDQHDRPRGAAELRDALDALPFAEPDEPARDAEAPAVARAPSLRPSAPPSRFVLGATRPDGTQLAHDTLVDRPVSLVSLDERLAARYRKLALADGPFLQAVLAIDDDSREAVLEEPRGRPVVDCGPLDRQRAIREVTSAVESIRATGARHGAIGVDRVRVGPGRAVLLLPSIEPADETDDLEALDALRRALVST